MVEEEKIFQDTRIANIENQFDREKAIVEAKFQEDLTRVSEGGEAEIELIKQKNARINAIEQDAADKRKTIKLAELAATQEIGNNVISVLENFAAIDKKNAQLAKGLAIARIVFSTSVAIMRIIEEAGILGIPIALSVGALGASQVAKVASQGFQLGGVVPGTGQGDRVPARLEPGERVVSNRELSGVGGLQSLENFLRTATGQGKQTATIQVAEGSGPMNQLARALLPFMQIELERA